MRRMYSVEELSTIVAQVINAKLEAGEFDEAIYDQIVAYVTEHPIDPTAITGLDIAPKDVTASGNITAPSIIENMSGYSMTAETIGDCTKEEVYGGIVKNGNKLTIAYAFNLTRTAVLASSNNIACQITIPESIGQKLYVTIGSLTLARDSVFANSTTNESNDKTIIFSIFKISDTSLRIMLPTSSLNTLVVNDKYYIRVEATFLLSDNLLA